MDCSGMPIATIIATMDMPKNILIQILTVELGKIWLAQANTAKFIRTAIINALVNLVFVTYFKKKYR